MQETALHIIASDVPYPPNYGGAVDMFYKLKFLKEAGIKIHLHCFAYGRPEQKELNKYCATVAYYPRKMGLAGISLSLPYMMYSRRSDDLLKDLQKTEAPILFEGVHTAYYLNHPELQGRLKIMRNQNLEQEYYALLGKKEKSWFRKLYYAIESKLLKAAESRLSGAHAFFTVALHDYEFFKKLYPGKQHEYIPSFQPYTRVSSLPGKGHYLLYHGNLAHPENEEAVLFLLKQIIPHINHQVIIAGRMPTAAIKRAAANLAQVKLIADPDGEEMNRLIAEAQVHVLPTFQATGLKLKLLHALFQGRHVIANQEMLTGTGLSSVCNEVNAAAEWIAQINEKMQEAFLPEEITRRQDLLKLHYDNRKNAERIRSFLIASHPE